MHFQKSKNVFLYSPKLPHRLNIHLRQSDIIGLTLYAAAHHTCCGTNLLKRIRELYLTAAFIIFTDIFLENLVYILREDILPEYRKILAAVLAPDAKILLCIVHCRLLIYAV